MWIRRTSGNLTDPILVLAFWLIASANAFALVNPVPVVNRTYASTGLLQAAATNLTTVTGAGFIPQSVVLVNGTPVATTFQSNALLTAQVPVAPTAVGSVSISVRNPAPGGGTAPAISLGISVASIQLAADSVDGRNTGTARLGLTVQMRSTVSGNSNPAVTWSLNGAGAISSTGLYQAPATMPSSSGVTVTATLVANSTVSSSYSFALVNPVPVASRTYASTGLLQAAATNLTTVTGTGFVPQSIVLANGTPVATTFQSSTLLTAQVPVAPTAVGSVSITVSNPAPGGGTAPALSLGISPASIQLAADSVDGRNTGTVRLGLTMQMRATVSGNSNPAVTWKLNGAGAISSTGLYQAPATMPTAPNVTVTATLVANSTVTSSYSFALVNPVPVISRAYGAAGPLQAAETNVTTINGVGFVPQSVVLANGTPVAATFQSSTQLTAQVPVSPTAAGTLSITVQNPAPGGGLSAAYQIAVAPLSIQLSSFSAQGLNPTSVNAGLQVLFTSKAVSADNHTYQLPTQWLVQGPGTISSNGLYQAPDPLPPGASTVIITAGLAANATVAASQTLTLLNAVPVVNQASPAQLQAGVRNTVTLGGRGFTPATAILVNGASISPVFVSSSALQLTLDVPAGQTTAYTFIASNPNPGAAQSIPFTMVVQPPAAISAQIGSAPAAAPVANSFMGFSFDWGSETLLEGSAATGKNPILRQLIENLIAGHTGAFSLRIGGLGTDTSGEPLPSSVEAISELAQDVNANLTLGVNLASDNIQLAADQAKYFTSAVPSTVLKSLEIGNEPDNYSRTGARSSSYQVADYLRDFANWSAAVTSVAPSIKLTGPAWSSLAMLPNLPAFEQVAAGDVSTIGLHYYAGYVENRQPFAADYLLSSALPLQAANAIAPSVLLAHQNGQQFRVNEINSIDLGGLDQISNSFSSALWAVDTMFSFANVGADGVNWHGGNGCLYCAFGFGVTSTRAGNVFNLRSVSPLYYGMLLFQMATPNGSALLPVTVQGTANVKVWAAKDQQGNTRLVVINKDKISAAVSLQVPGYGAAQLVRLLAPSYNSTSGISLAGQSFDGSIDGTPVGAGASETIPSNAGTYAVNLQPTSAVLLTLLH